MQRSAQPVFSGDFDGRDDHGCNPGMGPNANNVRDTAMRARITLVTLGVDDLDRGALVLDRRHLVGIDADHQVGDVIVDPAEIVAGASRNDNDVADRDVA